MGLTRKTLPVIFLLCLGLPILDGCKGKGPALVKVGRESITEGDLDLLTRVNPRLKPRLATPAGKQKVLENYVDQELLYLESTSRGLHRTKPVNDKLKLYEKIIVAQALLDDELDKKTKEYYENTRDEFERVKISHLLVRAAQPEEKKTDASKKADPKKEKPVKRSEGDALKMVEKFKERLANGEDFGKVAKEASEDDRTKNNQGDLGYITLRDKRLERWGWLPLAEKAFAMKAGEVSDPIKTKDGFHIIKVTEEKKLQPFEEAEAAIKFRLQADVRAKLLESLKKKYKVEYAKTEGTEKPAAPGGAQPETAPAVPAQPAIEPETPPAAPQAAPEPPKPGQ